MCHGNERMTYATNRSEFFVFSFRRPFSRISAFQKVIFECSRILRTNLKIWVILLILSWRHYVSGRVVPLWSSYLLPRKRTIQSFDWLSSRLHSAPRGSSSLPHRTALISTRVFCPQQIAFHSSIHFTQYNKTSATTTPCPCRKKQRRASRRSKSPTSRRHLPCSISMVMVCDFIFCSVSSDCF
jgi:hypothetical protein